MVLLALALVGACRPAAPAAGEARLVLGPGDRVAGLSDGQLLRRGADVRALAGEPVLELSRGRRVALHPGARVEVGEPLKLDAGEVLVTGSAGTAVDMEVATVVGRGATRVARGLDASVRVYEGSAAIESAQRRLAVGALQQASVPAVGLVPRAPSWVTWDRDDAWDNRYLGAVIELTDALDAGSRGFATQARDVTADELATLVPGVPASSFAAALAGSSTGEALVGAAITQVAPAPLEVSDVLALRADGASWGVVATRRAAGRGADAVRLVYLAIERWAAVALASGSPSDVAAPGGGPLPSSAVPSTTPAPASTPTTAPASTPPTSAPPSTAPTLPPPPTVPGVTVPTVPVPTTAPSGLIGEVIGGLTG